MEKKSRKAFITPLICLTVGILYVVLANVLYKDFFVSVKPESGTEQAAYEYFETGKNLAEDSLSRKLVFAYSNVLAIILVSAFVYVIVRLVGKFKKSSAARLPIVLFVLATALVGAVVYFLYPLPISASPDTFYNYVFAKEWLPMYWHGFFTNVVYCASFLIFPHPMAMTIVPMVCAMGLIGYCLYCAVIKRTGHGILISVLFGATMLLFPAMIETVFFVGRNFMYGIVLFALLAISYVDWVNERPLSYHRAVLLAVLMGLVITWRGEGILWIVFFPVILLLTYRKSGTDWKKYIVALLALTVAFLAFKLPAKYGDVKYQGRDYYVINTVSSLGAVFADDNPKLDYEGASEDISNIDAVIPIDWIRAFGENSYVYWNSHNGRNQRQCGNAIDGDAYIKSAYNVLLHNPIIWLKERVSLFCKTVGLPWVVHVNPPTEDVEVVNSAEADQFLVEWWEDYFVVGRNEIENVYAVKSSKVGRIIQDKFLKAVNFEFLFFGYFVIILNLATVIVAIVSLVRKQWLILAWSVALLGSVAVIFLTAPSSFINYYFYSFYCQYWLVFLFLFKTKAEKEK